ncbi:Succinylglutamate desuccinylase / Aspartoacylase family protein [Labrenzia sp. THAF191b]|uniref:succinylglutamate desuccinylase/aspartoacylase family protein n=1 Tax=unclassified Labrenzia TaxID=2648686 RepID=UPI001267B91C|nr:MULTISPECIES: succinylglutamate desuccinylase/aspartoacylase family protein [unclassified Labrenzia]QFS98941.1 Succinylglutamate desuccinylase / Aspartoacylase family protein [Labrenzia sp. THAF191b]QFT05255.1 Succinylglutamate desuccinylase / Aspartoacylase family protein [Labrenzia sp. THAF191a]QFT16799.1 Succinylglutamate desuccinylase / Aspartoacylase family protein [Labrenzia sp. THAF187b]
MTTKVKAFEIGDHKIAPGTRRTIDLPVSVLSDHTPVTMSVHVLHGSKPGPVMFVSAAVHGDEVIGVEIARRVLKAPQLEIQELDKLKGTLMVIPIVNAFGFLNHSRYLPDRRDLNRSFPGSLRGSLAGRLAHLFMSEIVNRSDYGIDLHSAAIHRTNLPQIRVSPSLADTLSLAKAFGAPVILTSKVRDGSLRQAAQLKGTDVLVFEAGEGLRFDEMAIRAGVSGVLRVMRSLKMLGAKGITRPKARSILSKTSYWVRSPAGGLLRPFKSVGDVVEPGMLLGITSDPFGEKERNVLAELGGLIVGRTNLPVVNEGDGLFHIAEFNERYDAETTLDSLASQLEADPLFDEDEII